MSFFVSSRDLGALIPTVREHRVILDSDLAKLYEVTTKALNQAVKRNRQRFPQAFMFQLTVKEKEEVVTNCDHLARLKFSHVLPHAFTEHGALMAANVLNSSRAISMSVEIVMAFVRLRQMALSVDELARRVNRLEERYDGQFKAVFKTIQQLMVQPDPPRKQIGFGST